MDMFSRFRAVADATPDAPFLLHPDGTQTSYRAALLRSGALAAELAARGVRRGDRVAVQVEKSAEALLTYLATLRLGAVYLPLNPAYTADEVACFLADAEPALFVCRSEDEAAMRDLCARLSVPQLASLDGEGRGSLARGADLRREDEAPAPAVVGAADLAAILYTSGTTGRSKGAMLTHGNLASNAATLCALWRFTAADRLLHALPIFHTHGLFVATNTVLCAGAAMILLPRFEVGEVLRLIPRASCMMGVPTFYTRLLASAGFTREAAAGMRLFVSGSAPLSPETHRAFAQRTGQAILERYGMTETNMNTSNPYDGPRKPGSVGLPLAEVALRIADPESGAALPPGEIGIIEVKGPNVFAGYWRMPEKTREEFRPDGYFITGDLGYRDRDGYVFISGRARDLVISGGFNIYPAEIEALIDAIAGVAESAVIGVAHPDLGEAVVAVVSASDATLDEAGVLAALAGRIARFKQPRRVILVPELPRNAMGKVQKALLREHYAGLFAAAA